jgi:hypothetical protein
VYFTKYNQEPVRLRKISPAHENTNTSNDLFSR